MSIQAFHSIDINPHMLPTFSEEKIDGLVKVWKQILVRVTHSPFQMQLSAKVETLDKILHLPNPPLALIEDINNISRELFSLVVAEGKQQSGTEKTGELIPLIIFKGNLEEVESLIRGKKITQEMLHAAILRGSEFLVKMFLLEADNSSQLITRSTVHLAQGMNNERIIEKLNENSPILWEENTAFSISELCLFLKYFADYPVNRVDLDLSGHAELTDDYFFPQDYFHKIPLKKLNLFDCVGITDQALEYLAQSFPCLEELHLGVERRYEDIEILVACLQCPPFPWERYAHAKKEYESYERRQRKITKMGLEKLARHCKKIHCLSLNYCHLLQEDIGELLANPENFPSLIFLDLSDCYNITPMQIATIQAARPQLEIKYERIFPEKKLPVILSLTAKKNHLPITSEDVLLKLLDAIRSKDLYHYLCILEEEQLPIEKSASPLEQAEEEESLESLIFSSTLRENRKEKENSVQESQDALQRCLALLHASFPNIEPTPLSKNPRENTERNSVSARHYEDEEATRLYAHKLEDLFCTAAQYNDFLFLYELFRRNAVFTTSHLNLAVEYNPNVESIRFILETTVLPNLETFSLGIKRKNKKILQLLLDAVYVLPEGVLDLAMQHLYNQPYYIQQMLQKDGEITEKTLLLAVEHNHFRVINLLLHWGALPTKETLNKAIHHKKPDPAVISLLENCLEWAEEPKKFEQLREASCVAIEKGYPFRKT